MKSVKPQWAKSYKNVQVITHIAFIDSNGLDRPKLCIGKIDVLIKYSTILATLRQQCNIIFSLYLFLEVVK